MGKTCVVSGVFYSAWEYFFIHISYNLLSDTIITSCIK
nr:MAG TPA: hypothetical protein [Inoviridae sp.]